MQQSPHCVFLYAPCDSSPQPPLSSRSSPPSPSRPKPSPTASSLPKASPPAPPSPATCLPGPHPPPTREPSAPDTLLRLTFTLTRSPGRQAAFTQLLADQQNQASPLYHQWLTPQQVGDRYGPTPNDLATLTSWLLAQGFTLVELAPSRVFLTVEAPAATVTAALATPLHTFNLNGEPRLATLDEPTLPTALAPLVASITGLTDTPNLPQSKGQAAQAVAAPNPLHPGYTTTAGLHYVTPGDFAVLFDINSVYSAGINGTGQKVAIIGRSRVSNSDVSEFETNTGLPANLPNVIIPATGTDPGINTTDEGEALLDVGRVIGTAPGVQADLVVSGTAGGYDGIYVAAQYEVQTLRDPVMNISFGSCEVYAGASGVTMWDTLFAQAAAEGISVFVSAGDSAAGYCATQFATPPAYQFRSVNYICASSYATCAGGTELVDTVNPAQYWSATNAPGRVSVLSYIPEGGWNDPTSTSSAGVTTYLAQGTGGGASIYVPKPYWQTGTGVPADGARDLPDLSFPASGHDGYYGCRADANGNCANGFFYYSYGTSAAAPGLAGVAALLNQKAGVSQGTLNPLLYRLAATPGVFHDTTPATSGIATCDLGTPSLCNNSDPGPTALTGGLPGYALTTGYDQVTGLGSLDVANFLTAATAAITPAKALSTSILTASASTVASGSTLTLTAAVVSTIAGTPTGTVQFYIDTVATGSPMPVAGGKASAVITFPNAGQQLVSAVYSGDPVFAPSTAPGLSIQVNGLTSVTAISASAATATTLTAVTFSATVKPSTGTVAPTGLVRFYDPVGGGYFSTVPLINGIATARPELFVGVTTHTITAYYLGDAIYNRSSNGTPLVVTQGTPRITWPVPTAVPAGTALSATQLDATANVAGTFAYTPPAGTVLTAGTQILTVAFTPTDKTNYAVATATVSLSVLAPDFTLNALSSVAPTNAGQTATYGLFVNSVAGFNSPILLSVTGLPANTTAAFSATTITPAAGGLASSTLSIATDVQADLTAPNLPGALQALGGTITFALLLLLPATRRRKLPTLLATAALLSVLFAASGCGGSSNTSTTPRTPDGTYTLTVTATSGNLTHTLPLTLTVIN